MTPPQPAQRASCARQRRFAGHGGPDAILTVVECHHVTGNFDYLLRVEVPDFPDYERFHADKLAALHNVGQLVTYISMTDFTDA
jgi:DNA-binding Lrp family transcriptional regulator